MKKSYKAAVLALICVVGLGLSARAQEREDSIIAKIPHDFLVGGRTLPGGTYKVGQVDSGKGSRALVISSYDTGANALVIPMFFSDAQTGRAQLSFEHVGEKYVLNAIRTPIGTYAIPMDLSAVTLAQGKVHGSVSSSGGN
jgi:hypothetical protein